VHYMQRMSHDFKAQLEAASSTTDSILYSGRRMVCQYAHFS